MSESNGAQTNNYTIGRGRLYFDMMQPGTLNLTGELYLGNTPSCETTQATTDLKHYSSESGLKIQDQAVTLQKDITVQFATDNIAKENMGLWLGADIQATNQAAGEGGTIVENFETTPNLFYQLGASDDNPMGVSNLATISAEATIAVAATDVVTFNAQPAVNDTITINGVAVTFIAAGTAPVGAQVALGGNFAGTAQNLASYVNANGDLLDVYSVGSAAALTLTAIEPGVAGNAITVAAQSAGIALATPTLTGGSAGAPAALQEGVDWNTDLEGGRFQVIDGGGASAPNSVVAVSYTLDAAETTLVITNEMDVYGALRFVADNPVGNNNDHYWPYVNLRSTGAMQLKGDNWQEMTFSAEVLKLNNRRRVYVRQRPGAGEGN